jgi:hypothetical protein
VDLTEFLELCSSDAIDDPGVSGVPVNGLYGVRNERLGDRVSPIFDLLSGRSPKDGSNGRGLKAIGDASPLIPSLIRFDR